LYSSVGSVAAIIGNRPVVAYVAATLVAVTAAYGGLLWLGRQLGLRGWMAHAPALTYVTSAYYVTDLYGRGAWTEFIAVSAIPLVIASAVSLLRSTTWQALPTAAFVLSTVYFTGSHTLTLVWGAIILLIAGVVIMTATGFRFHHPWRLLILAGLSIGINSWFLVPELVYGQDTVVSIATPFKWSATKFLDKPSVLFNPLRTISQASSTPALYVQVPVWFLGWAVISVIILRRSLDRRLRRSFVALLGLLAALLLLIMTAFPWAVIPHALEEIQFPYRLNSYVALAIAGLVMVAAIALERRVPPPDARRATERTLGGALVAVIAVSSALCAWQLWVPRTEIPAWSYTNRDDALVSPYVLPRTWYAHSTFADLRPPVVAVPPGRGILLDPTHVRGNRLVQTVTAPPGSAPFQTNIMGSPLVAIRGINRLGRTRDGFVVARRAGRGSGPVQVVAEQAYPAPVKAGDALTIASIVLLLALTARSGWHFLADRRDRASKARIHIPVDPKSP
jgi:hypothetical protein